MSNHETYQAPTADAAKNKAFVEAQKDKGTERYIQRHSLLARITHGVVSISCILLAISGLFVFVPPLAALVGADAVFTIRMSHRVLGCIFILMPVISLIDKPDDPAESAAFFEALESGTKKFYDIRPLRSKKTAG